MVLLNVFDCDHPHINGLPETDEPVKLLKKFLINLLRMNLKRNMENFYSKNMKIPYYLLIKKLSMI